MHNAPVLQTLWNFITICSFSSIKNACYDAVIGSVSDLIRVSVQRGDSEMTQRSRMIQYSHRSRQSFFFSK